MITEAEPPVGEPSPAIGVDPLQPSGRGASIRAHNRALAERSRRRL